MSPLRPIDLKNMDPDEQARHYAQLLFLATASQHGLDDQRTRDAFVAWREGLRP